jgi:ribosomal protein S18 acetylase RimI-like enzyme
MKFLNFPFENMGICSSCGKVETMSVVVERATEVTPELISAFELLIPQLSSSNPPPSSGELQEIVSSDSSVLFVARVDGQIVGSLTLATFRIPTGLRAWIEDVVVDSSARGHGVGEALNQAALTEARARGAVTVDLTSRPSREAANRLYQKLGFVQRETNVYRFTL